MNTVLSVKTDKETKAAAQEVAKSMGLTLSGLINSYLKQVIATRRVELYAPEPMTPELEAAIKAVDADIQSGTHLSRPCNNADEFLADLKRDNATSS